MEARTVQSRAEDPQQVSRSNTVGLAVVCCIPMLVIAVILLAAGGTKAGLMISAITAGAGIGMLMFVSLRERPLR
jgi:hypothetical protein